MLFVSVRYSSIAIFLPTMLLRCFRYFPRFPRYSDIGEARGPHAGFHSIILFNARPGSGLQVIVEKASRSDIPDIDKKK